MEAVSIKKRLVIELDVITSQITFHNEDDMSFIEVLGAIEYTKMMVQKDWNECE